MIKENQKVLNRIQVFLDASVIFIALALVYYLRFLGYTGGKYLSFEYYLKALIFIIPLYLFLYTQFGLYLPFRTRGLTEEALNILKANTIGIAIIISYFFIIREIDYSRYVLVLFPLFTIVLTIAERFTIRKILRHLRRQGYNLKHILVIGGGKLAQSFVSKVRVNRDIGYNVVGILEDEMEIGAIVKGSKVIGKINELEKIISDHILDEVIIAIPLKDYEKLEDIISICEKSGLKSQIVPDYLNYIPARPRVHEIDGLPLINTRYIPLDNVGNRLIKRSFDIVVSLICILIALPAMLTVALLVKLSSPGPIIFRQERVGLNRRTFNMYKFRSMKVQDKQEEQVQWTTKKDPRKTKIGEFIRKTSIDELPQLFNVLLGNMSLIGPRPERPYFVQQFKETIPKYMLKHRVRPGITGWAQVNGWRGDTSIEERIKFDLYYIENWSLALDIKILILTLFNGFINKNAY